MTEEASDSDTIPDRRENCCYWKNRTESDDWVRKGKIKPRSRGEDSFYIATKSRLCILSGCITRRLRPDYPKHIVPTRCLTLGALEQGFGPTWSSTAPLSGYERTDSQCTGAWLGPRSRPDRAVLLGQCVAPARRQSHRQLRALGGSIPKWEG